MTHPYIVIASHNVGKQTEIEAQLRLCWPAAPFHFASINQWTTQAPEETGKSFIDNALLKARQAAAVSQHPALADDSGLCIAALNGAPGLYSARYAGLNASDTANIDKVLTALYPHRQTKPLDATFVCALAYVRTADDPEPLVAEGHWPGEILATPQGTAGFGYDPIFFDPHLGKSAANMTSTEKQTHSHRARAMQHLVVQLQARLSSV